MVPNFYVLVWNENEKKKKKKLQIRSHTRSHQ